MTKFQSLQPILWTDSLDESIQFYTEILEFSVGELNEDW